MSGIKKVLLILGIVILLMTGGIIAMLLSFNKTSSVYNNFDFSNLDLTSIDDGTYIGMEDGKMVKASVEVTVKDHDITQITILSHDCGKGKPAEAIVQKITEDDSLLVDTVSGATYSSNVIKMAVYHALTSEQ